MKQFKVVILTEGGKSIGLGHVTRCKGLYQGFVKLGINPRFIIHGDSSVKAVLDAKVNYDLADWLRNRNHTYSICKEADIVIIDSYLANSSFYKEISKISAVPAFIDDYMRIKYPKGVILNGSIGADDLNYNNSGTATILGPKFIPLRKEFWKNRKRRINKSIQTVLFTLSGMNFEPFATRLTEHLKTNYAFRVIDVYHSKRRYSAAKMKEMYLSSDLCISGGGQSTYELACCGTPTIGICLAANQIPNLKNWESSGFLLNAGYYTASSFMKTFDKLMNSLDFKSRVKMSRAGMRCVDGKGSLRVASRLLAIAKRNLRVLN